MKSCFIAAATATVVTAGFSNEFIKGMQTGAFVSSHRQLSDYNCPAPEIDPKAEKALNMFNMVKKFSPSSKPSKKKYGEDTYGAEKE